jgi:hypothetical protein
MPEHPDEADSSAYEREQEEAEQAARDAGETMTLQEAMMLDAEILRAQGVDVADPIFFDTTEPQVSPGRDQ